MVVAMTTTTTGRRMVLVLLLLLMMLWLWNKAMRNGIHDPFFSSLVRTNDDDNVWGSWVFCDGGRFTKRVVRKRKRERKYKGR
jgi:hypothetical protein